MKIIHSADIHLGSKIDNKFKSISDERKTDVRNSFAKMVEYAKDNNCNTILLSGDVFDSNKPLKKDKDFFYSIIKKYSDINFYYLRGNHDAYELNSESFSNLITFNDNWSYHTINNIVISSIEITENNASSLYSTLSLDDDKINIVMLHGQISDSEGVDKIRLSKLSNKNIDYLALGHIHSYSEGKLDTRGKYVYSGCLEGRGFDETLEKGFVLLDINENDKKITNEFIPFSSKVIYEINVDVSSKNSTFEIIQEVKNALKAYDKEHIYRVNIVGEIDYNINFTNEDINRYLNDYYFIDIKNKTTKKIDIEKYKNDLSLRGEFIRMVLDNKELSDERKNKIIMLGLRLLEGNEVDL